MTRLRLLALVAFRGGVGAVSAIILSRSRRRRIRRDLTDVCIALADPVDTGMLADARFLPFARRMTR
jgi:hypothetical protein